MAVIVVMGVSGSGKTTVGGLLAAQLGWAYAEADSFHPRTNIDKMAAGTPLDDTDRTPWLRAIATWIGAHAAGGGVVSSSALAHRYRDILRTGGPVWFLHLHGTPELIATRMAARPGHFMPTSLLDSQFAALEPLSGAEAGLVAEVTESAERIVDAAVRAYESWSRGIEA
ncbi:gluconokinase [Nocardia halotolerans]|uniref:Gluconokinase n=1 Tax=Nocardia halotolerans TaxID=1755878 RepID=A0ABV8VMU9_9NOCA